MQLSHFIIWLFWKKNNALLKPIQSNSKPVRYYTLIEAVLAIDNILYSFICLFFFSFSLSLFLKLKSIFSIKKLFLKLFCLPEYSIEVPYYSNQLRLIISQAKTRLSLDPQSFFISKVVSYKPTSTIKFSAPAMPKHTCYSP